MTFKSYGFSNIDTGKYVVSTGKYVASQMSKKPHFRIPCDSQHVKESVNLHHSTYIILFHDFGKNRVGKYRA